MGDPKFRFIQLRKTFASPQPRQGFQVGPTNHLCTGFGKRRMATVNTGLGGPQGVGEGSVRGSTLTTGNYDDGSLKVNVTSVFGASGINYFGTNYTSIYINTNGQITFAALNASYTPTALGGLTQPAIAPFWTDLNITSGTATGTNNIYCDLDPGSGRVTITWLGVAAYSGGGDEPQQVSGGFAAYQQRQLRDRHHPSANQVDEWRIGYRADWHHRRWR